MKGLVYIYTIFSWLWMGSLTPVMAQELEEEVKEETIAPEEHAFIIDAQIRARGEYMNGAIRPRRHREEPGLFVNDRARLSIGYASNGVQLQISAQQAGLWGSQGLNGANSAVSLNEAWGQIHTNNRQFSARVGRQYLSYDNGRILGTNDWTAAGNSHNALRLAYEDEWNKLHLFGSISQTEDRISGTYYTDSLTNHLYKNMAGAWYHFGNDSFPLQASLLFINEGHENGSSEYYPSTVYMQTMGGNISFNTYHFGLEAEGYYQMGTNANEIKTNSWMAAASIRYTPNNQLTLKVGADMYSGTKLSANMDSTTTTSFCPTYSSYHNFLGEMQYFGQRNLSTEWHQGVMDIHFRANWTPRNDLSFTGAFHHLSTADMIRISEEVDLKAEWHFRKDVTITAAYAFAFNSSNMIYLLGGNNKAWQDCAYLQINFSPRILFHKW